MSTERIDVDIDAVLRRAADLFHEIGMAVAAEGLLVNCKNLKIAAKLQGDVRSSDQLKRITADGFELCVRALAARGAGDVTIHGCGEAAFGEAPWGAEDPSR